MGPSSRTWHKSCVGSKWKPATGARRSGLWSNISHLDPVEEENEKDALACTNARAVDGRVRLMGDVRILGRGRGLFATELSGENWREARRGV